MTIQQIYILAATGGFILGVLTTCAYYANRFESACRTLTRAEAMVRHPSNRARAIAQIPLQRSENYGLDVPPGWPAGGAG